MDDSTIHSDHRFVLLRHELPASARRKSHWDLMLENHGKLLTWEVAELPNEGLPAAFASIGIVRLPDHRLLYLDYSGPISGGRGSVKRIDFGHYEFLTNGSVKYGLNGFYPPADLVPVKLVGSRFEITLGLDRRLFLAQPLEDQTELAASWLLAMRQL
jgi:DNA polymerase Ligase (LigD)